MSDIFHGQVICLIVLFVIYIPIFIYKRRLEQNLNEIKNKRREIKLEIESLKDYIEESRQNIQTYLPQYITFLGRIPEHPDILKRGTTDKARKIFVNHFISLGTKESPSEVSDNEWRDIGIFMRYYDREQKYVANKLGVSVSAIKTKYSRIYELFGYDSSSPSNKSEIMIRKMQELLTNTEIELNQDD